MVSEVLWVSDYGGRTDPKLRWGLSRPRGPLPPSRRPLSLYGGEWSLPRRSSRPVPVGRPKTHHRSGSTGAVTNSELSRARGLRVDAASGSDGPWIGAIRPSHYLGVFRTVPDSKVGKPKVRQEEGRLLCRLKLVIRFKSW